MGTSASLFDIFFSPGDHPHAYGDKGIDTLETIADFGSSPRVWGQGNF